MMRALAGVISQPLPPSSLLVDLESWWTMDSAPATMNDAHGSLSLIRAGSPTSVAGHIGNAVSFVAYNDTYYATRDNTLHLAYATTPFTMAAWVKAGTYLVNQGVFGRWSTAAGWGALQFGGNWQGRFQNTYLDSGIVVSTTQYQLVIIWRDTGANVFGIQVDQNTPATMADYTLTTANYTFAIGRIYTNEMTGIIDEAAIWNRALTADERALLYNGGSGIAYGDL